MASILARSVARARFTTALVGAFASTSVLLAGVGLFGVVSHGVGRRQRELAICAALGASPGRLVMASLAGALRAAALGAAVGALGAVGLGRALGSLLYDVSPADPASLAGAALTTLAVAAAAGALAASRAGRVAPAAALQAE
jgi:ABC-type antimicrobial peptide transport system permease subunit